MKLKEVLEAILIDWSEAFIAIDNLEHGEETGVSPKILKLHLDTARSRLDQIFLTCSRRKLVGPITPRVAGLLEEVENASIRLLTAVEKIDHHGLDSGHSRSAWGRLSYGFNELENLIHQLREHGAERLESFLATNDQAVESHNQPAVSDAKADEPLGVSMRDLVVAFNRIMGYPKTGDEIGGQVKQWMGTATWKARRPEKLGKDPDNGSRQLYKPSALLDFLMQSKPVPEAKLKEIQRELSKSARIPVRA